jgi:hypothetical protein
MKNTYILPTDKPSRLFIDIDDNKLKITQPIGGEYMMNQHIYITNSEEIKDGDYMFDVSEMTVYICVGQGVSDKKIILTTDQDLIADGVQAIDDEFLEWFVMNPSCEDIEVVKYDGYLHFKYMVIIPKEEPKQETLEEAVNKFKKTDVYINEIKQETLEEREPYWDLVDKKAEQNNTIDLDAYAKGVQDGVKWQAERMYSEEKLHNAFYNGWIYRGEDYSFPKAKKEWFEQFKKK